MRKILLFFLLCITAITGYAEVNQTTSKGSYCVVIAKSAGVKNHIVLPSDCPDVVFNSISSQLSIDFGNQPVNNFTVTISSLYADVDYYATSSFTTIPLAVDGISDYSITIETGDGDLFEGTLYAADYATTATF